MLKKTFECCGSRFKWYCMMKIVRNWIHTFGIMYGLVFVRVLSIDAYVVTEISEFHWWSKSPRLRYQVVRSWWRSSCTPWHMRCTAWVVLNLSWYFFLDSLVIFVAGVSLWLDLLNTGLPEDVVCWISYMCKSMWDLCDCFMLRFEEDWIIEKLIHVIWFSLLI